MFVLSAFADRPYWASCLEPLLYPSGCSFYRPFSYREDYVAEPLRSELKDDARLDAFLSDARRNIGIFGIRFKDESEPEYRGQFIPLRKVSLTNVQVSNTYQLSFKIGEYVMLTPNLTFHSIGLDDIIDYSKPEDTLLFEIPQTKVVGFGSLAYESVLSSPLWDRLAEDQRLSPMARRNFLGTIVLRLIQISERGEISPLLADSLEPQARRKIYGFKLESNKTYDLDLAYDRILTKGENLPPDASKMPEATSFDFAFRSPTEHFDIAQDRVAITGNYRRQTIWVEPKVGRPGPIALDWIGVKKTDKDSMADPKIDKILPLHVPVLARDQKWPRERILYAIIVSVSVIGALTALYLAYKGTQLGPQPQPQPGQQPIQTPPSIVPIWTAVAAFFLATATAYLKDLIKGKS